MQVYKSVYANQQDILKAIQALHCPQGFECDLTFGNGQFWGKGLHMPELVLDITPLFPFVIKSCSTKTPLITRSLNSVVFDPPFLTYINAGRDHGNEGKNKMVMSRRFGGYWSYAELEEHYVGTIKEANRLLVHKGKLVFKCQDIIHNHRMHATHVNVANWGTENGFRLADMFVLVSPNTRLPRMGGAYTQKHARVYHSYFLVLEKRGVSRPAQGRRPAMPTWSIQPS